MSWNPDAITFATNNTIGSQPFSIFINTKNMVYVADQTNNRIQVWHNGSVHPARTIFKNLSNPHSLFVTTEDDIYVSYTSSYTQVDKWTLDANSSVVVMSINYYCNGLFVDISNTLYCSVIYYDQVVKQWLSDSVTTSTKIAGTGTSGSTSDMLSSPHGIFVDINFDLYVADCGNNRIQLFHLGQLNALTVAGKGAPVNLTLNCPTGIVLDADNYLFIVDSGNHRIIRSWTNGFRCVVGCSGSRGSGPNQLSTPWTLSFDSYGNMFVADRNNGRIQKFILSTNSSGKYKEHKII